MLTLLISQPLAVTRTTIAFELGADPPRSQSWETFLRTIAGEGAEHANIENVDIVVRLGALPPDDVRTARLDDGLVGFWIEDEVAEGPAENAVLRMPKSTITAATIAAHDSLTFPPEVTVTAGGRARTVTMLIDPRGLVHAVTGLLPTKRLAVDPAAVARGLSRMEVALRAGPILTRRGHVDHVPVPDPDLEWRWVDSETDVYPLAVESLEGLPPIPAELELRSGFLLIGPASQRGRSR